MSAPYVHPIFGFDQGFDHYEVLGSTLYDEEGFEDEEGGRNPAWQQRRIDHDRASHQTESSAALADRATEAIARLADEPFLLFVHMFDAPLRLYASRVLLARFDPDYAGDFDPRGFASNRDVHRNMPKEELEHVEARYDGEILWVDEHIGRILDALESSGVGGRTHGRRHGRPRRGVLSSTVGRVIAARSTTSSPGASRHADYRVRCPRASGSRCRCARSTCSRVFSS